MSEESRISYDALVGQVAKLSLQVALLTQQLVDERTISGQLRHDNQLLRDEIARLKGQKGKPDIKPNKVASGLGKRSGDKPGNSGRTSRARKSLTIDETQIVRVNAPAGSRFLGYVDFVVQDVVLKTHVTKYRRERWLLPDKSVLIAPLPAGIDGKHYGPELRRYVVYLHHHGRMPQARIVTLLRDMGLSISAGQVDAILQDEALHLSDERDAMVHAGVTHSPYVQADDTGARHQGQNGFCTHLGNSCFAAFFSTKSKSRLNFINILSGGKWRYVINETCINHSGTLGLSQYAAGRKLMVPLAGDLRKEKEYNQKQWDRFLREQEFTEREQTMASEAALYAAMRQRIDKTLIILSDDAGQFNLLQHALCWVHAERKIHHLIPRSTDQQQHQERVRAEIWAFYDALKRYQKAPKPYLAERRVNEFNRIFTQTTGYGELDQALKRLHDNKKELLLVLKYPHIPLHNNDSERDIREYVIRRKISSSTRSDTGRQARDIMISLMKTCGKLGVSFYQFLGDRIHKTNQLPSLAQLVENACKKLPRTELDLVLFATGY